MKQLHPKTLETLADMVCGENTGNYRSAAAITRFLQRADRNFPDHDGTSRRTWVLELLDECNQDEEDETRALNHSSLEAVMLQIVDPRESRGEPEMVQSLLTQLNRVLAPEGLLVILEGATPRLQSAIEHMTTADTPGAQYLLPDFRKLASDTVIITSLRSRWEEAQRCIAAQAHLSTVLLLGSILEGVLMVMIQTNPAEANRSNKSPNDKNGKAQAYRDWTLHDCIEVACDCG